MSRIELREITKKFKENMVIDHVSALFEGGHIYGFMGRNGSGKTVLLKLICGLMAADAGEILINGKRISHSTNNPEGIGAIIEAPGFLSLYSGYKNLRFLADLHRKIGRDEIKRAMQDVGLEPNMRKRVGAYSLGMRQRLGLAQALMEDPEILILDEPMNGLDDAGVELVRALLLRERSKGKLILMATHVREDVEMLCDTNYRIKDGKLV